MQTSTLTLHIIAPPLQTSPQVVTSHVAPEGSRHWAEACLASITQALQPQPPPPVTTKRGKGKAAPADAGRAVRSTQEFAAAWCVSGCRWFDL